MAARLAAVVVAIGMVAVALVARDRVDGGDTGERSGPLVLACITELARVCEEVDGHDGVEVRIGQRGDVAGSLADPDGTPSIDAWLTFAPWPESVDGRRGRAGAAPLFAGATTLARSPLVIGVWADRTATLARRCGEEAAGWRCLGEAAAAGDWAASGGDESWGAVKVGLSDPSTSALGPLVLAQATVEWFSRDDVSRFDLETDDGYRRWLAALEAAVRSRSGGELEQMLLAPAALDAAAATEAQAVSLLARLASGRPRPDVIYPAPMATADVVLATIGDRGRRLDDGVRADLEAALAEAGWRLPDTPAGRPGLAPETPPLPQANGLPPADVVDAIGDVWAEMAR